MKPGTLSVAAAAALLSTGGFFGQNVTGILSDLLPGIIAGGLLLIPLATPPLLPPRREAIVMVVLLALSLRSGISDPIESASLALCAIAVQAGARVGPSRAVRNAILGATAFMIVYALFQRYVLFPEILRRAEEWNVTGEAYSRVASGRVFATYILPGQFSAFLAVVLPLALAASLAEQSPLPARLLAIGIAFAFALSQSLSGIVAAMPSTAYLLGQTRRAAAVLCVLVAIAGCASLIRTDVAALKPLSLRVHTWNATIRGALDAPLLGHGAGSFERLFMKRYFRPGADEVRHPHSWPLKVLFESGTAGLAAWLVLAAGLFRPVSDRSFRAAALAFFCASLLDVADHSVTLRMLGCLLLGVSIAATSTRGSTEAP